MAVRHHVGAGNGIPGRLEEQSVLLPSSIPDPLSQERKSTLSSGLYFLTQKAPIPPFESSISQGPLQLVM